MNFVRQIIKSAVMVAATFAVTWANGQTQSQATEPRTSNWVGTLSLALQVAKREKKPIMVCFLSPTCGPCTAYRKGLFPSIEFKQATRNMILVDVDVTCNRVLTEKFKVKSTPDIRILGPSGKEFSRVLGFDRKGLFAQVKKAVHVSHR